MTLDSISPVISSLSLAIACAVLSVVVVLRRWAFIGEGISHSGFGGAGLVWLAALWFPRFDTPSWPYAGVFIACIVTGFAIAWLTRSGRVSTDSAIGLFLVTSLAFGFLAQAIYVQQRNGRIPPGFDTLLFGNLSRSPGDGPWTMLAVCAGVVITLAALWKEILSYSFDPVTAETSGVRAGAIHYVLVALMSVLIVAGARIAGSVLVTALLVLPGMTAMAISRRMNAVLAIAVGVGVLGASAGLALHRQWKFIPAGPVMVLAMFLLFIAGSVYAWLRPAR